MFQKKKKKKKTLTACIRPPSETVAVCWDEGDRVVDAVPTGDLHGKGGDDVESDGKTDGNGNGDCDSVRGNHGNSDIDGECNSDGDGDGTGENKGTSDSDGDGCSEGYSRDDVEVASDGDSDESGDCDRDGGKSDNEGEGGFNRPACENLGDIINLAAEDDILVPMFNTRLQDKNDLQIRVKSLKLTADMQF